MGEALLSPRATGDLSIRSSCRASKRQGKSKRSRKVVGILEVYQLSPQLIQTMCNVRTVGGGTIQVRKSNKIAVAERHIPKCKNIINKPKPPPSMRGGGY